MKRTPVVATFGLLFAAAGLLRADNQFVNWDFGFSPSVITITAGDSVTWVDTDFSGTTISVSSDGPGFFFMFFGIGDIAGHTFSSAGMFIYHDNYGNGGTITVNPLS